MSCRTVSLLASVLFVVFLAPKAWALPAIHKQFLETYKESKIAEPAKEAKCNVCHFGETKKNRNDYGTAISKLFNRAKYDELKSDKEQLNATIEAALKKVERKKSVSGKLFGELIKAGKLPGTAPKEEESAE